METEEGMEKSVEYLLHEFASVRTGKASASLVENIDVEAYGSTMKVKQLAVITTPEPRMLLIQPFDVSTAKPIEKAISESKIGINPAVDGKVIRLPIPELSEERRKEFVRTTRSMAEEARVRVRGHRRHGLDELKKLQKNSEISEDEYHRMEEQVQKLTDKFIHSIDEHLEHKEKDIMQV